MNTELVGWVKPITLERLMGFTHPTALLAQGKADLATAAEAPFVLAVMKGEGFSIVASVLNLSLGNAIVARRDHGIAVPRDLLGKKVGVTFGTTSEYFLWAFLIGQKLAPGSVTLLDMPPAQLPLDLAKGSIDAIATWQPIVPMPWPHWAKMACPLTQSMCIPKPRW